MILLVSIPHLTLRHSEDNSILFAEEFDNSLKGIDPGRRYNKTCEGKMSAL